MPTYEFRCPAGHEFEKFYRKISDGPSSAECPECHQMAERRVSGGAGLLFKGSGFYITDYKKSGAKSGEGGEGKSEGKSEGKGSESKGSEGKASESKGSESKASDRAPKGGSE
jgi:putative FmdB family regulatory protein